MTENTKVAENITNINLKLKNLGVKAFSIALGVTYQPEFQNLADYSKEPILVYRCEFEVPSINANLIIEFKFTPLASSTKDVIDILTIKNIPQRDFKSLQKSNGLYQLYEEINVKADIEKFNNTWDKIMTDAKKLFTDKEVSELNNAMQTLRSNKDALANLNSTYPAKIDDAVHSNSELNLSKISTFISNKSSIYNIIYLFLQHRSQISIMNDKILGPNEQSLKNFSWDEFYKSNMNISKNIGINYLSKIAPEIVNEIVFNTDYNRSRGGSDKIHNRTTLTLAYFTLLTEFQELSKDDIKKINDSIRAWGIHDFNFSQVCSELWNNDIDNSFYFSLIENFYKNIFDVNKKIYLENQRKAPPHSKARRNNDFQFRFTRGSLSVLFSTLKSRDLLDFYDNKYRITDKGLSYIKKDLNES